MRRREDVIRRLEEIKQELRQTYGVTQLGLFGSFMKGTVREESDIDILVDFSGPIDLLTFVQLKNRLSDVLGANVDLVMKRSLKPRIGEHILREVVYV
jgi:predicted nucleotidyltransferase